MWEVLLYMGSPSALVYGQGRIDQGRNSKQIEEKKNADSERCHVAPEENRSQKFYQ